MNSKSSAWVGGTVVVSVLILALAWFVAISPTLASASSARTDTQAAEMRNSQLEVQLAELKAQFANLDASKAELAALRLQIPTETQLAEYIRTMQAHAEASGVTIVELDVAEPEAVAPADVAVEAPTTEEPAAEEGAEGDSAAEGAEGGALPDGSAPAEQVPSGPVPVEAFAGYQIQVTVVGTAANGVAFLEKMQTVGDRLFLVTEYDGRGLAAEAAKGMRPETQEGDMELKLTGYVWVLPPLARDAVAPSEPEDGVLAPLPGGADPRLGAEGNGTVG
ncbi:hypothetical protein [Cellulomonas phragmiteti]|uniref:Pilus assembly protein PilO n=1 Tax=Cellulomonas phragmiteti TaxID=478780 RepID=A0ABQ4DKD9_9CELL|nr:hypothetical protein [Cellulomonas phragmiteti]GIG39819.1 hypothetical protein Cph01nite_15810 [Cellulomonas phragmiteti]